MQNTSQSLIKQELQPTTLTTLQKCTETKQAFNALVKLERNMSVSEAIIKSPLIITQGRKIDVVSQIIRIIEFFLEVTGKELESYQIQILAGDIYEKFKTDTLDDVVLMLKMARQGDFGKVYKCDTFEVMDWCNKYLDHKSATRERLILKKKKVKELETQGGKSFHDLPQELQDKFNNIGKDRFLPKKASNLLLTEKERRDIDKKLKKKK